MKPKRKKRKKKKKQTTPHTPPVELESLEKRRDKYIGGRRDVSAFVGWREGGKKGGGGERRNVGTKRERLVAGVPGWGFGGRRRKKGGCGGFPSRAALTWARKSMGPPTRTQTRSVEPRTRPI